MQRITFVTRCFAAAAAACLALTATAQEWKPMRPIEFIGPAGAGGADQMARFLATTMTKNQLSPQPILVVNKGGLAGAEGFLDAKSSRTDGHKIIITLSNLFTTPLSTGVNLTWRDLTPVSMLALDQFVLWVNASSPYQTAGEYLAAIKAGENGKFRMGGTGSKQEDQIITAAIEKATGKRMTYVPYRGGTEVANNLASRGVDSTVNNPIEALALWKAGQVRPLCVFDAAPMPYDKPVTDKAAWKDIPSCKSQGLDVEYLMLRGIFAEAGATDAQVKFYQDLLSKAMATPEWKKFLESGAFRDTTLRGAEYRDWLGRAEEMHARLMRDAGFVAAAIR